MGIADISSLISNITKHLEISEIILIDQKSFRNIINWITEIKNFFIYGHGHLKCYVALP